MRLPDGLGLELIKELGQQGRSERAIVVITYSSASSAVEALKQGAFDYLTKPLTWKQFRTVVATALQSAPANTTPAASGKVDNATGRAAHRYHRHGRSFWHRSQTGQPAPAPGCAGQTGWRIPGHEPGTRTLSKWPTAWPR